jgi:uncharacterized repeat protein (TIGR01451 family)
MRILVVLAAVLLAACGSTAGTGCGSAVPAGVAGQGQPCGNAGRLSERISTDLTNYSPGSTITITVTVTNTSTEGCAAPTACPPLPVAIDDANGTQAWTTPNVRQVCPALARLLQPGESVAYTSPASGVTLATGVYSVTGSRADTVTAYGRSYFTVC